MKPSIKIESGVPMPHGYAGSEQNIIRDALLKMKVGQSFLWHNNSSPYNAATKIGVKVRSHKINGQGWRYWLIARPTIPKRKIKE